jgi:DNA mismatch repair protein MutS2
MIRLLEMVSDQIDIHRLTIDEAMPIVDRFIHDAYTAGLWRVVIVHGKGTGTLRLMVDRQLARHPLVASHRLGGRGEGGDGATIVELSMR